MTIMTISRIHRNNSIITLRFFIFIVVLLLIITPHQIIASTTTTSLPTTKKLPITTDDNNNNNDQIITTTPNDDDDDGTANPPPILSPREAHVLRTLHARYESIMNGDRLRLFSLRYRRHSDRIDLDLDEDETNGKKQTTSMSGVVTSLLPMILSKIYRSDAKTRGLFPSEGLSLAFPPFEDDDDDNLTIPSSDTTTISTSSLSPPSTWRLIGRTIVLGWNFAPCIATVGLAVLSKRFREGVWYDLISWGMARSGPAFIKWGQWASTRSDMFPEKLCLALSHLHNDAPAHSFLHTQTLLSRTLHIPPTSLPLIFSSISPRPIASGSIAQIHTATLHPLPHQTTSTQKNRIVALKVIHPHVSHLLDLDFRLMSHLANLLHSIPSLQWIDLRSTVDQFCHSMSTQCRLDVEAHHLEVLNYNFRRWRSVGFPRPMVASEEGGVIVETFEEGEVVTKIMDYYETSSPLRRVPLPIAKFCVTRGVGLYMKMLLVDNVMHSDLHPGNIMLSGIPITNNGSDSDSDGTSQTTHRITLVDAGMVATLSRIEAINFIGLLVAIGDGNACAAVTSLLKFSSLNNPTPHARLLLSRAMSQFFSRHCRGYHTSVDVGVVLRGLLTIIRDYKVRIDANYATLFVNMLCIEGMARRVCPEYNVLDASRPLLVGYKAVCGDEGVCHVSQTRRNILKIFAPFLYLYKKRLDNQFFGRLQQSGGSDGATENGEDVDDGNANNLIRQLQQGRTVLKNNQQRAILVVSTAAVVIAAVAAFIGGGGEEGVLRLLKDQVKVLTDREWNMKMILPSSVRRQLGGVKKMMKKMIMSDDGDGDDGEQYDKETKEIKGLMGGS